MKKTKWIICGCCEGNGQVGHPAFSNGFTSSEWHDMGPDDQATYMRGDYDVQCEACKGLGRVEVPNVAALSFGEKRVLLIELREARVTAKVNAELDAEWAAERAFGC